jgi:uncharacterized damage-inducible protein DinB
MSGVPYAEALGGRDAHAVIAETPVRLAAVLEGVTAEEAEVRPAPGKWCLREVMAHLADCEIAWSWRLRIAFEKDRAEMQPFEQDPWAKMYGQYSLEAAKATFFALRAWNVAFVAGLREADRGKVIVHPERGEETLWTIVEIMAGHDLHHLKTLDSRLRLVA